MLNGPLEIRLSCNKGQRVLSEENQAKTVTACPEEATGTLTWELRNGCDIQKQYSEDRYQLTVRLPLHHTIAKKEWKENLGPSAQEPFLDQGQHKLVKSLPLSGSHFPYFWKKREPPNF